MFAYENLTVGADPEFFLKDTNTNRLISSIGLVGGSKEHPKPIDDYGHCIQEDNVAVEFNIPAARDAFSFTKSIQFVLDHVKNTYAIPNNLELAIVPSGVFDEDQLNNEAARTFGCDPDFNIWTMRENPRPEAGAGGRMRTAGGHIHVGFTKTSNSVDEQIALVRAMDLFIGVPSVLLDDDTDRRSMYGKAGAYRDKSYGVEYRTVSNFWIKSEKLINWAFESTLRAVEFCRTERGRNILNHEVVGEAICNAINNSDRGLAEKLINKFSVAMV